MITVLTATNTTQGMRANDYNHCSDDEFSANELVTFDPTSPTPDCPYGIDHPAGCACQHVFVGVTHRRTTTTARVTKIDMTPEQYTDHIIDSFDRAGLSDPTTRATRHAAHILTTFADWPPDTIIERHGNTIRRRAEPRPFRILRTAPTTHPRTITYMTREARDAAAHRYATLDHARVLTELWSPHHPQDDTNQGWASDGAADPHPNPTPADPHDIADHTTAIRTLLDHFDGDATAALVAVAHHSQIALAYLDRTWFEAYLRRNNVELTDELWDKMVPHIGDFDSYVDDNDVPVSDGYAACVMHHADPDFEPADREAE